MLQQLVFLSSLVITTFPVNAVRSWQPIDSGSPRCIKKTNTEGNKLFGYSIDVSDGLDLYTYLAVGRPYDGSVSIYRTLTPERTPVNYYEPFNGDKPDYTPPSYNPMNWTLLQQLVDTNGSAAWSATGGSRHGYSLYGWSVSLGAGGKTLAVGIPGRNRRFQSSPALDQVPMHGSFRIFERRNITTSFGTTGSFSGGAQSSFTIVGGKVVSNGSRTRLFTFASLLSDSNTTVIPLSIDNKSLLFQGLSGTCSLTSAGKGADGIGYNLFSIPCTLNLQLNFTTVVSTPFNAVRNNLSATITCTSDTVCVFSGSGIGPVSNVAKTTWSFTYEAYGIAPSLDVRDANRGDEWYNSTEYFWERHGMKVMFSKDPNATFLFVVSNNGNDGSNYVYMGGVLGMSGSKPAPPGWANSYNDTSRLGVSIYRRDPITKRYARHSFIRAKSLVPLGLTGLDIAVLGNDSSSTLLAMRDWQNWPDKAGSGPSGQVVLYRFNLTLDKFVETDTLHNKRYSTSNWMHEDWFGKGISLTTDDHTGKVVAAVGAPRDSTQMYTFHADYARVFSASEISSSASANATANITTNGTSMSMNLPSMGNWNYGPRIFNEDYRARSSFFGGTLAFSPNAEFLVVADPSGRKGRGRVFLYRNSNERMPAFGLENEATPTADPSHPYNLYQVAEFAKTNSLLYNPTAVNTSAGASSDSTNEEHYATDWFGLGVAVNWWTVVIGSPLDECFYTYAMPQIYNAPSIYAVPSSYNGSVTYGDTNGTTTSGCGNGTIYSADAQSPYTYCCRTDLDEKLHTCLGQTFCYNMTSPPDLEKICTVVTKPDNDERKPVVASKSQATKWALIAGLCSAAIILPTVWLIAREVHKRKVKKQLEQRKLAYSAKSAFDRGSADPMLGSGNLMLSQSTTVYSASNPTNMNCVGK